MRSEGCLFTVGRLLDPCSCRVRRVENSYTLSSVVSHCHTHFPLAMLSGRVQLMSVHFSAAFLSLGEMAERGEMESQSRERTREREGEGEREKVEHVKSEV